MKRQKKENSRSGSALIYVLIASVTMMTSGLYLMQQLTGVESSFRNNKNRQSYTRLVSYLRVKFEDPHTCTEMLKDKNIESSFSSSGTSLLPVSLAYGGGTQTVNSGWKSPDGAVIDKLVLHSESTSVRTPIRRDIASSPLFTAVNAKLSVYTKKGTPPLKLSKYEHFKIELMLYYKITSGSRKLYSCFGRYTEGALCTLSGGAYNTGIVSPGAAACEPDLDCFISKEGVTQATINPITFLAALQAGGFSGSSIPSGIPVGVPSQFAQAASVNCNPPFVAYYVGPSRFQCMWCNRN